MAGSAASIEGGRARTLDTLRTACAHSSGCSALKTKIMMTMSSEPGSMSGGGPSGEDRSQTEAEHF